VKVLVGQKMKSLLGSVCSFGSFAYKLPCTSTITEMFQNCKGRSFIT